MYQSNIYAVDRQQKQLEQQRSQVQQLQREVVVKRILASQVKYKQSSDFFNLLWRNIDINVLMPLSIVLIFISNSK